MLTRRNVNELPNSRIAIETTQKLASFGIIADLSELECDRAMRSRYSPGHLLRCILNRLDRRIGTVVAGRLSIGDRNNKNRLLQGTLTGIAKHDTINNLLSELTTHWCKAAELDAVDNLVDLTSVTDVIALAFWKVGVHEANRDAIGIKEGRSVGNALEDDFEILDALSVLFECHGAAVVNEQDDIIKS